MRFIGIIIKNLKMGEFCCKGFAAYQRAFGFV
jgi:hypothetical protein